MGNTSQIGDAKDMYKLSLHAKKNNEEMKRKKDEREYNSLRREEYQKCLNQIKHQASSGSTSTICTLHKFYEYTREIEKLREKGFQIRITSPYSNDDYKISWDVS